MPCAQREKETLPNFYRRFLQLKAQSPEVSDDQVIVQSIKTLRVGPLHSHLVRERPKTMPELYEQFTKLDEVPRPRYSDNQCNYSKLVHNINSDGYGHQRTGRRTLEGHRRKET
jgi:hypothetical protein